MTTEQINRARKLIHQVNDNDWKVRTGSRSERLAATESNADMVGRLCGALDEALNELEKRL